MTAAVLLSMLLATTCPDLAAEEKGFAESFLARIGCTVRAPFLKGMRCRFLDWNLREIGAGSIRDGRLKVPSEKPVFTVEISRWAALWPPGERRGRVRAEFPQRRQEL